MKFWITDADENNRLFETDDEQTAEAKLEELSEKMGNNQEYALWEEGYDMPTQTVSTFPDPMYSY